jgi:hypothetical protein
LAKPRHKILVLGNGPQINDINFDLLDPNVKTFGVNRIWLKHYPNYFFFQDHPIIRELDQNPIHKFKLIGKSRCFSSDWLKLHVKIAPAWLDIYPRSDRKSFPDSITSGLKLLSERYITNYSDYTFYIAGVNLKWMEPSHFWKQNGYQCSNKFGKGWYDVRFNKMLENFKKLQSLGFNLVSVTPDSNLNKIMRFENIENLYLKQELTSTMSQNS